MPNIPSEISDQVKYLVGENQLKEALDLLESTGLRDDALALKGRLKEIENREQRGVLEAREYDVTKNKIRDAILELLNPEISSKKRPIKNIPIILAIVLVILSGITWMLWPTNEDIVPTFQPLFPKQDSTSFNVLILRFEDYIAGEDTYCIGRSIQENLNTAKSNQEFSLTLNTIYVDSIAPPETVDKAISVQKKHNADLVIYGLARRVQENCSGAEVCFRYNIAEEVTNQIAPVIQIRSEKHDLDYMQTSPFEIEKGKIKIDALSLELWVSTLISVKAGDKDNAFLNLDQIANDTSLTDEERADRYFSIGLTYGELKQPKKAIHSFNKSILHNPGNANVFNSRGVVYGKLKEYKRAIQDFNRAIKLDSNFTEAFNNRGVVYRRLKEYELAVQDCNQAIKLNPNFAIAFNNRGNVYYDLKEYKLAIQDLNQAIKLNPNFAMAFYNRSLNYFNLHEYELAMQDCNQAIKLHSNHFKAFILRGLSYFNFHEYKLAIQDFNQAIKLDSNDAMAFYNRGLVYDKLGEYKLAIQDYDQAIKLDSNDAKTYYYRGIDYGKLKEYKLAIQDFNQAIKLDSNDAKTYYCRGLSYYRLQEYKLAIQDYDQAIKLDSNYVKAFNNRGIVYGKLKEYKLAIQDFNQAIKLDPNDDVAIHQRNIAYRALKKGRKTRN